MPATDFRDDLQRVQADYFANLSIENNYPVEPGKASHVKPLDLLWNLQFGSVLQD